MFNHITIGRFAEDPEALGVVRPADGSWRLVLDKDNFPHLYVRVKLEQEQPDDPAEGLLCIEDLLPPELKIRDLMAGGSFGGKLTPDEETAAHAEYLREKATSGIPCPR